ncbi:rho guanine nucleotide exchange factor 5-like isoform X1 [Amphibalanus amphitrite]|uniref:rho guanine nucleotide exchange factor 5-like isoform X1 n=1 Tax=Amphibalanus amphitrite TaxID=1232801 RepID=UPI001C91BF0A|nr:rho guanine nucleotide exchange factor 5-like isoform X1 [Amphibalanus amphitrite]XP_043198610.1 rho guanine nucleotide exchange factor 5-like isoform X1 [Amphibalanus amphitrite]XP_043208002.1 rho guanine nucleotide exchange factor 5-like isoform X1 [Amphibalanus amphitrite]
MAEANVSKNNPPMEDIWRVEIGQIIIRFRTNKPKGALCVWQNLVSQLSTLLNGCFETEALVLWKMLLNAIPELLRTSHIAETQTLWRSLTETVLEIRAVGYSQTASAMWKTLLAMAPKLLAEFPNGVTELMWTEVCQTAAEMESGASDPERTPLPASPSPSPLPLPTASPALTSSPVQPPPPLPSRSRSPLPTLSIPEPGPPAGLSPGSSPKRLSPIPSPKRPSPAPSPTRSSPGDPRQSRFDPRRTPLPPPPVQQLPSAQAPVTSAPSPALTQSTSPSPSPSPTTAQYLPPKPRPISQSGLQETQHSKPPKPKVKPKPLLANRKTFTAPSLAPSIQPAPRPVVKQQPLVVTQSGDQVSTTDSEWDQGMQQVLTELSHRGIGDLQRGRRTGRMGNVRPKSCQNPTDTRRLSAPFEKLFSALTPSGLQDLQGHDLTCQSCPATATDNIEDEPGWVMVPRSLPQSQAELDDGSGAARVRFSASATNGSPPGAEPVGTSPATSGGPLLRPSSSSASLTAPTSPSSPAEPPLWCRLPSVINSGVLDSLSSDQRKLREALFEIISKEESYHSSLQLLERHFQEPLRALSQKPPSPKQNGQNGQKARQCTFSETEYRELFQNVDEVRRCSDDFLTDLYQIPMDDLSGLCDIVHEHAKHNFYPYKVYCAHKWHQDRCLQQLTERSSPLAALLSRLEMSPEVRGLGLAALLHLPVQHVQRLPMMMEAVLKRMPPDHPERQSCEEAHRALTKLVKDCDEDAAREEERLEAEESGTVEPERAAKGRLSWRRRGVRRHSADVGSLKRAPSS